MIFSGVVLLFNLLQSLLCRVIILQLYHIDKLICGDLYVNTTFGCV